LARHKAFSFSNESKEQVTFELAGEQFTCIPDVPGGVLSDFIGDAGEGTFRAAPAMVDLVKSILIDEDVPRFERLIRSKTVMVPLETLIEVVAWLVEQYTGRPTMRPSPSVPGPSAMEPTSKGAVSATAST